MSRTWGIVPAAGLGTRIQPLAFSKELLPVGTRYDGQDERPRAVGEYIVERMLAARATNICFIISPAKNDIISYFGGLIGGAAICYTVQQNAGGLCDALFRALPFITAEDELLFGLPDTVWFPIEGFRFLPTRQFSFLCFPSERPEFFDAVVSDRTGRVEEVQVKQRGARSNWVWGAFRMPGSVFRDLHELWCVRDKSDEYLGTLVNNYIARGGSVQAINRGEVYVDVGTLNGYREAVRVLSEQAHALDKAA